MGPLNSDLKSIVRAPGGTSLFEILGCRGTTSVAGVLTLEYDYMGQMTVTGDSQLFTFNIGRFKRLIACIPNNSLGTAMEVTDWDGDAGTVTIEAPTDIDSAIVDVIFLVHGY